MRLRSPVALAAALLSALLVATPVAADVTDVGPSAPGAAELKGDDWGTVRDDPRAAYTRSGPMAPATAEQAREDQPAYYADEAQGTDDGEACHAMRPRTAPIGCRYGDLRSAVDVWVLGSSKSGQWMDPLVRIAEREGWRLTAHTKSACSYVPGTTITGYPECEEFNDRIRDLVRQSPPELVVFSPNPLPGAAFDGADQARVIEDLLRVGVGHVAILPDSLPPTRAPAGCLESGPRNYLDCTYDYRAGEARELNRAAGALADARTDVSYLDVEPWLCPEGRGCPAVVGGVQTTGKGSHVTATYARTMVNVLHRQLRSAGARVDVDALTRIGGADRYETAANAARAAGLTASTRVYLATGTNWPDAVSAAALGASVAGGDTATVLLTRPGSLPPATKRALAAAREVVILGDTDVVSAGVEAEVRGLGKAVTRAPGEDRYATAARLAADRPVPGHAYLAVGSNWPDATTASAHGPTLLTQTKNLPQSTRAVLREWASSGLREVTIVGDEQAVSAAVAREVADLGVRVRRVGGASRYDTAAQLVAPLPDASSGTTFVTGSDWPDAVAAAGTGAPVLLTRPEALPKGVAAALDGRLRPLVDPVIIGGRTAVSPALENRIADFLAPR